MATKSMDLGQVMGTSAYQEAQAGGYTGTKEEFQKELAEIGNGGGTFVIQADANVSPSGTTISNVDKTLDELNAARQAGKAIRLKLTMSDANEIFELPLVDFAPQNSRYICVFSMATADVAITVQFDYENDSLSTTVDATYLLKLSDNDPAAPGTASAGTSDAAARADHVHPKEVSDTDRATWNGKASKPTVTTVTLTAAGWNATTKKQTVTVPGVLADTSKQVIWVTQTTEAAIDAYLEAGIVPVAQAANAVTLRADTVPTADITVNIVVQEVQ